MIFIIQVYPYATNNGCSVRIGKGYDLNELLQPEQCIFFDFVESHEEVKTAISIIRHLPNYYRGKFEGIEKLQEYDRDYGTRQRPGQWTLTQSTQKLNRLVKL